MLADVEDLNVHEFYAVAALWYIREGSIGRRRLADRLGLTESKTRTMLDHLREAGLVAVDDTLTLTGDGRAVVDHIDDHLAAVREVALSYLSVDDVALAALLTGVSIGNELALRDEAVRAGATGMTTLRYDDGFVFPSDAEQRPEEGRDDLDRLHDVFGEADQGDVLIIVSASSEDAARAGLWKAVASVLA